MSDFRNLRQELGIESNSERKGRIKDVHKDERRLMRMGRRVLKDLRRELFPESKLRKLNGGGWGIWHFDETGPGPVVSALPPSERVEKPERKKNKTRVYDIAVRPIVDDEEDPTCIDHLECWRSVTDDMLAGDYGTREFAPPSCTCEPARTDLVAALKELIRQHPPGV